MADGEQLTEQEELLMPDPANGELTRKAHLLKLAKKRGILRIAAEKGLTVDDAIRFIERHRDRIDEADFPEKSYGLLK